MSATDDSRVIDSSGNVFAEIEVVDPDEALVKAELARAISTLVAARHLSQT